MNDVCVNAIGASDFVSDLTQIPEFSDSVVNLKPRVLLRILEERGTDATMLQVPIPPSQIGSTPVFDAVMLAVLIRIMDSKNVLEFGTYIGYSTRLILENASPSTKVSTIDLPQGAFAGASVLTTSELELHQNQNANDEYLREMQFAEGARYLRGLEKHQTDRLLQIRSNSLELTESFLRRMSKDGFDFVFIDGGHDQKTIESDTNLAMSVASTPSLIVWHDYGSLIHTTVTTYLNAQARHQAIYTIKGTLLAFSCVGFHLRDLKP